jgi:hypothetical protein
MKKLLAAIAAVGLMATPVQGHTTGIHDNCTKLNRKWPHGVGRRGARDETNGKPVTNFTRNTRAYNKAEAHNSTLDRDDDGIACEKA